MKLSVFLTVLAVVSAYGQTSRPFYMSVAAVQTVPTAANPYQNFPGTLTPQAAAPDTDLISVFPEYLGIPFDLFATTSNPPSTNPWVVQMTALANQTKATGKPIMLQTTIIRESPVAKANISGNTVTLDHGWAPRCMDFTLPQYANISTAYGNYASYMMRLFNPRYYVVMIEANLYYVKCGGNTNSWKKFVDIYRNAYIRAKLANLFASVFPSFKLEDVYGQSLTGFDATQWAAMAPMTRDRLGLAIYPFGLQTGSYQFAHPFQLPPDYLNRIRVQKPSEPRIVITETGWNSDSIGITHFGACYQNLIYSSPSYQAAFLNYLMQYGYTHNIEVLGWWSTRDLLGTGVMNTCYPEAAAPSYTACGSDIWCKAINADKNNPRAGDNGGFAEVIFKAFGSMGLRDYNGVPKTEVMGIWNRFLVLPRR